MREIDDIGEPLKNQTIGTLSVVGRAAIPFGFWITYRASKHPLLTGIFGTAIGRRDLQLKEFLYYDWQFALIYFVQIRIDSSYLLALWWA